MLAGWDDHISIRDAAISMQRRTIIKTRTISKTAINAMLTQSVPEKLKKSRILLDRREAMYVHRVILDDNAWPFPCKYYDQRKKNDLDECAKENVYVIFAYHIEQCVWNIECSHYYVGPSIQVRRQR